MSAGRTSSNNDSGNDSDNDSDNDSGNDSDNDVENDLDNDSHISLLAIVAVGLAGLLGVAAVSADPASSADSAWSPLPIEHESDSSDPLEKRGQAVFDERCAACHGEIPEEIFGPAFLPPMPGTQALRDRYGAALPAALERRTDLAPEYVEAIVRDGLRSMPFFRPTEVSDEDLEALVAYLTRDRDTADE